MTAHDVPDLAYGDAPDAFDSPDGRTYSAPASASQVRRHEAQAAVTAGQVPPVDVNELLVTPAAAVLYGLCSAWDREAFRIPWMLGEKDPRAQALQDCATALRDAVNSLRRDGAL